MSEDEKFDGLEYIAASPPPEHCGFHPKTVQIAKAALANRNELLDALAAMVEQHCHNRYATAAGELDSCANCASDIPASIANTNAMLVLAKYGRIEIYREDGRRVIGRLIGRDQK